MDAEANVRALGALRIAVGLVSWLTPNLAARLFGLNAAANPQAPYLARLFGVRDLVLGVATMTASGQDRRRWLIAGLVCDSADAAAAGLGYRDGYLPAVTTAMLTAPALAAVGMGAKALGDDSPPAT
jgi:Domain of unknown function (DUF4267)